MSQKTQPQQNKYNVGQKIPNGRISQVQHSGHYFMQMADMKKIKLEELYKSFANWTKKDANWLDKPVYVVNFKTPVKVLSFQEFLEANKYLTNDLELQKEAYEKLVEVKYQMILPEVAIQIIEEDDETDNSGERKVQQLFDFA